MITLTEEAIRAMKDLSRNQAHPNNRFRHLLKKPELKCAMVVPIFKNNETFADVGAAKNNTFNQADSNQFNHYLVNNNVDYYFSVRPGLNLTSYKPIKEFDNALGNVIIYKRI